ncbi:hypothetical protein CONCODRAFT_8998 [Conidiobolus coronatus NRRL 28638]|uniref:Uncharacterized protein n=1 Tax=Conidiobolus coronatus (strain ATCC 28846 / CBS 209.66 / NRRL 28638) TaxID=796925 RepID=A0A137P1C0_CONC2|nr:hypothetical protein CONCODRAFT_8998 [Conidiobolus coronatus NRRL 28638]|eukprot:KXN68674.1 hypothetical protein CONCODRAFT_8998 [Conidiobolus coronatus NRRL 28638]
MGKNKLMYLFLFSISVITITIVIVANTVNKNKIGYLTWEIPGFAYINNQIVLHVATEMFNPTNRKLYSPGLWFPPIHGSPSSNTKLSKIFEVMPDMRDTPNIHYVSNTDDNNNFANGKVDDLKDIKPATSDEDVVLITNNHESLWGYVYIRFIIYTFIIGGYYRALAHNIVDKYKFRDGPIKKCTNMIMGRYPIKDSLGIHLRTWGGGVSLVHARECETIHKHNPLKLLWACRMNYDLLQPIVNKFQNVIITTDDPKADIIKQLKNSAINTNIYMLNYTEIINECLDDKSKDSMLWMNAHGNIFSTFSNIVAIKRKNNSYFVQTTFQYIIEEYLFVWLSLPVILGLSAIVYRVYNKYKINNFYQRIDEVELDDIAMFYDINTTRAGIKLRGETPDTVVYTQQQF